MAIAITTTAVTECISQTGYETLIQVAEGLVYVVVGDDDLVLTPGDSAIIPPGTDYRSWSAGDDEARWVEVRCAG